MIRTFLAIPIIAGEELIELSELLKGRFEDESVRWVRLDNLHITIRFFGDLGEEAAEAIGDALFHDLSGFHPFEIRLRGLGMFGSPSDPKVLWAGIENIDPLNEIRTKVDLSLEKLAPCLPGRKYTPHLTIARMKTIREKIEFLSEVSRYESALLGKFAVSRIILFKSITGPGGVEYYPLKEIICGRSPA